MSKMLGSKILSSKIIPKTKFVDLRKILKLKIVRETKSSSPRNEEASNVIRMQCNRNYVSSLCLHRQESYQSC